MTTKHILSQVNPALVIARRSMASHLAAPVLYFLAITLAEGITTLLFPVVGLAIHSVLLVALIMHAAFTNHVEEGKLLLALSLAPLIRLLSLSLPLQHFPPFYSYLAIGVPLTIAAFLAARVMKICPSSLGLNARALPLQILVMISGIGLGYAEYRILSPDSPAADLRWTEVWLPALILLTFTGLLEEVVFRGLMQSAAVQVFHRWGILYVSAVYAVMHLGYKSAPEVLFAFLVGLFFGIFSLRTGSILGVAFAHGLANITLYLVIPIVLR